MNQDKPNDTSPESPYQEWRSTEIDNVANQAEEIPPPPSPIDSSVAVAAHTGANSKWLYFLLVIVLVVFIGVTVVLLKNLMQEKQAIVPPSVSPSITRTAVVMPSFTPVPTIEIDPAVLQLEKTSPSDEIKDLEADINSTDMKMIDQSIATLNAQLKSFFPKN